MLSLIILLLNIEAQKIVIHKDKIEIESAVIYKNGITIHADYIEIREDNRGFAKKVYIEGKNFKVWLKEAKLEEILFAKDLTVIYGRYKISAESAEGRIGDCKLKDIKFYPCYPCKFPCFESKRLRFQRGNFHLSPCLRIGKICLPLPVSEFDVMGRASGFLIPQVSYSKKLGLAISQGIFLAPNPFHDITMKAMLYQKSPHSKKPALGGTLKVRANMKGSRKLDISASDIVSPKHNIKIEGEWISPLGTLRNGISTDFISPGFLDFETTIDKVKPYFPTRLYVKFVGDDFSSNLNVDFLRCLEQEDILIPKVFLSSFLGKAFFWGVLRSGEEGVWHNLTLGGVARLPVRARSFKFTPYVAGFYPMSGTLSYSPDFRGITEFPEPWLWKLKRGWAAGLRGGLSYFKVLFMKPEVWGEVAGDVGKVKVSWGASLSIIKTFGKFSFLMKPIFFEKPLGLISLSFGGVNLMGLISDDVSELEVGVSMRNLLLDFGTNFKGELVGGISAEIGSVVLSSSTVWGGYENLQNVFSAGMKAICKCAIITASYIDRKGWKDDTILVMVRIR